MWTAEQEAAIGARNWSVLVSAAAGSGKTAVLVERIVRLVMEGKRLSRMLIVTFTRAAAGEMRERLNRRLTSLLREDGEDAPDEMRELFIRALEELPDAQISTIHSFCQHVLAQDFQQVGMDPETKVADTQKRTALFDAAFREAMNSLLEEGDGDFALLTDCFTVDELRQMTGSLHSFLMSLARPWEWLDRACAQAEEPLGAGHFWIRELLRSAEGSVEELLARAGMERALMDEADAVPAYASAVEADLAAAESIASAGDVYAAVRGAAACEPKRLSAAKGLSEAQKAWKERFSRVRDGYKEALAEVKAWAAFDAAREQEELSRMAACLRGLRALVRLTDGRFTAQKREKSLMDFSDMEQLTLKILEDEELRRQCQQEYDFLFVDECQDVSEAQDAIISAVHGPESCLFLVGDVKQSIYRFRRADPTIFMRRVNEWSDAEDARERRIFLTRNFRSCPTVLSAANQVFSRAMLRGVTELDYMPQDWLVPCRDTEGDPAAEIVLAKDEEAGLRPLEAEAAMAAGLIRELVGTRYTGFDGEEHILRYRDICILMREVASSGGEVSRILEENGIPVYYDSNEAYAQLSEIRAMTDMLQLIDNPLQDLPLMAVLRSDWFGFTDSEMADIRLALPDRDAPYYRAFAKCAGEDTPLGKRCREAQETLDAWRVRCDHSRLSDFVWRLMHETGFYAAQGALPGGEGRMANLRMLYTQVQQFEEAGGVGAGEFLKLFRLRSDAGDARSAKLLGENEDLVRVMTMHKSKGLEFPVVICMRLSQGMRHREMGQLQLHPALGACLPVIRRDRHLIRNSFARELFSRRRASDEMAETCRLLYVAMTRAKERLILTGCVSEVSLDALELPPGPSRVAAAKSMMDWILQAETELAGNTSLQDASAPPFTLRSAEVPPTAAAERPRAADGGAWLTGLETGLPAEPPRWAEPEEASLLPQKMSVTALVRAGRAGDGLPVSDEEETPESKHRPEAAGTAVLPELPERPAFLAEARSMTAAERGTLTHRFLAAADLASLRGLTGAALTERLADSLCQAVDGGMYTAEEAAAISIPAAASFFESELGRRALASAEVRRELPFNLVMAEGENILQGVIDCCFIEDGGWIIVDYKTDRIESEQAFAAKHRAQLGWYAKALETITGIPVRERWLYALSIRKAVRTD